MKAYVLKSGKKTIEISRHEPYLWRVAMAQVRARASWSLGLMTAGDKAMLRERGFEVLPGEFKEAK